MKVLVLEVRVQIHISAVLNSPSCVYAKGEGISLSECEGAITSIHLLPLLVVVISTRAPNNDILTNLTAIV